MPATGIEPVTFLSAIAQDESHSISENVKWAYRERFKRGEYRIGSNRILGYDTKDCLLVPNKDAMVVKEIYSLFLGGAAMTEIADALAEKKIVGRLGRPLTANGVRYILTNEVYTGDWMLQKRAPKNFLTK